MAGAAEFAGRGRFYCRQPRREGLLRRGPVFSSLIFRLWQHLLIESIANISIRVFLIDFMVVGCQVRHSVRGVPLGRLDDVFADSKAIVAIACASLHLTRSSHCVRAPHD